MNFDTQVIVEERHGGQPNVAAKCPKCRKWAPMYPVGNGVYTVGMHKTKHGICGGTGLRAMLAKVPPRKERI